jgi:hypothetical protein
MNKETKSNLNTAEQVREYVKTLDKFDCELEYTYEFSSNSRESRWTPCSDPDMGGKAYFGFGDNEWNVTGRIYGFAAILSDDYFLIMDEEYEGDPPKTHKELHHIVKQWILDDVINNGYEGEISVGEIEEVFKEQ